MARDQWKHKGVEIAFSGLYDSASFNVNNEILRGEYPSLEAAKSAIDTALEQSLKEAGKQTLDLNLMTAEGGVFHVTGIHRGTGRLIGAPQGEDRLYPVSQEITSLLDRRTALRAELDDIDRMTSACEIRASRSAYRLSGLGYNVEIEAVRRDYANAVEKLPKPAVDSR